MSACCMMRKVKGFCDLRSTRSGRNGLYEQVRGNRRVLLLKKTSCAVIHKWESARISSKQLDGL